MATTYVRKRDAGANLRRHMSHWSRPVPLTQHTEHWSKLRCKSYQLTQLPTGHFIQHCKPKVASVQSYARRSLGLPTTGTLAAVGSPDFSQYLFERIHHPAHITHRQQEYRERVPSASSQRAKRGFKYWTNAAKPPTPGQKVVMGSKGNFLGIGIPRL